MSYIVVGLGNPGEEYEQTRHNVGRMALELVRRAHGGADWKPNKKLNALESAVKIGKESVTLLMPETMMNNSGKAVAPLVKNLKQAEKTIVVYDEMDLPLGALKLSFNRGDGGHRGLASIIKHLKTRAFMRVRVGISLTTPGGKLKKPATEKQVIDFILGKFKPAEETVLKKSLKAAVGAIESIVVDGRERAMNEWNSR